MIRQLAEERPGVQPGPAEGNRGGHDIWSERRAQRSREAGELIAYTDLLAPVSYFLNTRVFVSFLEL